VVRIRQITNFYKETKNAGTPSGGVVAKEVVGCSHNYCCSRGLKEGGISQASPPTAVWSQADSLCGQIPDRRRTLRVEDGQGVTVAAFGLQHLLTTTAGPLIVEALNPYKGSR
jgi:hypothetical protein